MLLRLRLRMLLRLRLRTLLRLRLRLRTLLRLRSRSRLGLRLRMRLLPLLLRRNSLEPSPLILTRLRLSRRLRLGSRVVRCILRLRPPLRLQFPRLTRLLRLRLCWLLWPSRLRLTLPAIHLWPGLPLRLEASILRLGLPLPYLGLWLSRPRPCSSANLGRSDPRQFRRSRPVRHHRLRRRSHLRPPPVGIERLLPVLRCLVLHLHL
jgi:hypothetical protein